LPLIGGVETHVHEVGRRLVQAGLDITVTTTDLTGELSPEEDVDGIHVQRLRAWPSDRDYYFAPGIFGAMQVGHWDLVHCQGYHTMVTPIAMLSALRLGIPFLVTFHSGGHSSRVRTSLRRFQRVALRPLMARAAALVAVSDFEADYFAEGLRIPRNRFVVVPNGSNLPRNETTQQPADRDHTLIVSVGRLERYKGHHRIIAALPIIRKCLPSVRLRIVGSGPYEAALRQQARRCGVADCVDIGPIPAGVRAGMASLLSRAALVTLLSEYEAHSISVIEALAMGCPVLVADTSGLHEFADRGQARGIPLNSSPDEVAGAVLRQIADPIAAPGVQVPTWDDCAAGVLQIYRDAVAGQVLCAS
jgi:glycosyltransferase involved in cell wall biosynthesis